MHKRTLIGAGSLAMLVIAAGAVILALHRYGGADGVVRRVRVEFAVEQPYLQYVPTPEDLITTAPVDADQGALTEASPLPTISAARNDDHEASQRNFSRLTSASGPANPPTGRARSQLASQVDPADVQVAVAHAQDQATATPVATAAPTPALPATMRLDGLAHYWQTWNNCGPAILAMNLSYFGLKIGQDKIGAVLRPEKDDKNVSPDELAEFARAQGLRALVRVNGDAPRLKALLAADIPVLVETWYEPKPNDGMGHYRLIVGYDDAAKTWIAYDSYDSHGIKKGDLYAGVRFPYDSFDKLWKVFGRTYVPIYDPGRAKAVEAVLAADRDDTTMWQRALAEDLADVKANPKEPFAWFNLGTDYLALGDFKAAAQAYDTARRMRLPWRMLWYQFGPFRAYYEIGRHKEVIVLADATIKTAKNDEELFFWKGLSQKALGDLAGAKTSLQQAVKLRPSYKDAQDALREVE